MILTTEVLRVMLYSLLLNVVDHGDPAGDSKSKKKKKTNVLFSFFFFFFFPLNLVTLLVFHTVQAHSQASRLWQNTQSTVVNLNSSWKHR